MEPGRRTRYRPPAKPCGDGLGHVLQCETLPGEAVLDPDGHLGDHRPLGESVPASNSFSRPESIPSLVSGMAALSQRSPEFPRFQLGGYALMRYPVLKIHHTIARHMLRKRSVMKRLRPTLTSAIP